MRNTLKIVACTLLKSSLVESSFQSMVAKRVYVNTLSDIVVYRNYSELGIKKLHKCCMIMKLRLRGLYLTPTLFGVRLTFT